MIGAMDQIGNPSSVHAEGRGAKSLIEHARAEIASAIDAGDADIVFTSSATEAAALACAERGWVSSDVEHDAVLAWTSAELEVAANGAVKVTEPGRTVLQSANSETGVLQQLPTGLALCDMTQSFGKEPISFRDSGAQMAIVSAHKLGGPKGVGALVLRRGLDVTARIRGGGQEMGRRSGTENIVGIAGFGAAAAAAVQDVAQDKWTKVRELRNILESALEAGANKTIFVGKDSARLPNTSCIAVPGWKGETQVMQMDLSGFAVSAGSACSSGKVRASRVLGAMGYDDDVAAGAIRISLGLETTENDVLRFAEAWLEKLKKHKLRAA